jgi:outer membrane lipoprotein-sorting protein
MSRRACRVLTVLSYALSLPIAIGAQEKLLSAEDLVKKAIEARGGAERIKAVQAERVTGTISFAPGLDGPFAVELKRPGKLHMEVIIQGQTIVRVYDGRGAGWIVNPFSEDKGPVPMSGDDLKNIADESDFDGPLVDYQDKGNKVESLGKDEVSGKQALKLKLTTKSGDMRTYYFDATTFLLLKWEAVRETAGQETRVESFFSDYRDVNGLKYAFEIDTDAPGTDHTQKLTLQKIELNPQVDDVRFTKPETAAPGRSAQPKASKEKP